MSHKLISIVSRAILAIFLIFAGFADAEADKRQAEEPSGIKNFLTEHTLIYPDELGRENLIHFGRFGTFDWYFPCQFESGSWSLGPDLILSLTYDSPGFKSRQYKLARLDEEVTLTEPDSGGAMAAKIVAGNRLPYG